MISSMLRIIWGSSRGKGAPQVVKFDFMGDRKLVFSRDAIAYVVNSPFVPEVSFAYRDIESVGVVRRKQRWALVMTLLFAPLCLLGMAVSFGEWGGFIAASVMLVLLGLFPLGIYLRGRPFLVISTPFSAIPLPMDRYRRQIRQIIDRLRTVCPANVRWELPGLSPSDALSPGVASSKIEAIPAADQAIPASPD